MTNLYKAGEMVQCFCTKCGWHGEAAAPMFSCGGCGKYVAAPLDRDKRRANAAEAALEKIRAGTADLYVERDQLQARVADFEAAFHKLANRDFTDLVVTERAQGAEDMRERVAQWLRDEMVMLKPRTKAESAFVDGLRHALQGIRALPIDEHIP